MDAHVTVTTERASQYLASLCKHFAHKIPVRVGKGSGQIEFDFGQCDLSVNSGVLTLKVTAENRPDLEKTIDVMTNHLERFAFRENLDLKWQIASDTAPKAPAP